METSLLPYQDIFFRPKWEFYHIGKKRQSGGLTMELKFNKEMIHQFFTFQSSFFSFQ